MGTLATRLASLSIGRLCLIEVIPVSMPFSLPPLTDEVSQALHAGRAGRVGKRFINAAYSALVIAFNKHTSAMGPTGVDGLPQQGGNLRAGTVEQRFAVPRQDNARQKPVLRNLLLEPSRKKGSFSDL